ncbi:hypothetical protein GCM10010458_22580 [Microbacterium luteolum]
MRPITVAPGRASTAVFGGEAWGSVTAVSFVGGLFILAQHPSDREGRARTYAVLGAVFFLVSAVRLTVVLRRTSAA